MCQLVLGIDSSTQSCKAVLVDPSTGRIVDEALAAHPAGAQINPRLWVEAMLRATGELINNADPDTVARYEELRDKTDGW